MIIPQIDKRIFFEAEIHDNTSKSATANIKKVDINLEIEKGKLGTVGSVSRKRSQYPFFVSFSSPSDLVAEEQRSAINRWKKKRRRWRRQSRKKRQVGQDRKEGV